MIELNSAPEVVKTSLDTYSMYVNFTEVKIAKIYDVAQENAQQFINSSSVYRNFAIGFFIFMLLLIVMVSYTARKVLENVLLEGINHIKDIAKDLSDGKLKINKRYDSKDEIGKMSGDLIEAVSMLISYISDITKTLGELSNGKLDIKLDESIEYKGDFIPIRKSFENIISSLNNIFYNTHQSISLVSQSSTKLADTTELLSEGSTDQAGAIEELLASFNEILNRVKNNSENAEKTNKFSDKTKEIVEKGNNKMHELMCSMEEINESSKKIAHIINSIEEISSKTNLLALNAAIEAARAGEVGKGFAVVAEEVRKLAEQSSRAVNETTQIIKNSLFVVNNGSRLAEETAKALNDIVNNVDNTADLIKEIAISSEEQKESISQMTEEIEQISKVVQVNSSTAEEISVSIYLLINIIEIYA
jgi:methyl-accepting chemotaxis protein